MSVEYLKSYFAAAEDTPLEVQRIITNICQSDHDLNEHVNTSRRALEKLSKVDQDKPSDATDLLQQLKDALTGLVRVEDMKAEFGNEIRNIVQAKQEQLEELQGDYESGGYLKREQEAAAAQRLAERRARSDNARRRRQQQEVQSDDFEEFEEEAEVLPTSKRAKARQQQQQQQVAPEPEPEPESEELVDSYCVKGCTVKDDEGMVGCDNEENCVGQWFHYKCVGLDGPPTTKTWYVDVDFRYSNVIYFHPTFRFMTM
eukprot:TRINITY_DN8335_c0_g1_i2.p1 TRINITY_DN8335_c0_g1~~TRINITY_DN8335_c0_g1_i2.p1  ORF type:complete len:258 (+),score=75.98 TRINITY_DN8335_c0_g1_i2:75-848(+)